MPLPLWAKAMISQPSCAFGPWHKRMGALASTLQIEAAQQCIQKMSCHSPKRLSGAFCAPLGARGGCFALALSAVTVVRSRATRSGRAQVCEQTDGFAL
jgi:hypothetical protein